jgi:hypothetical protein
MVELVGARRTTRARHVAHAGLLMLALFAWLLPLF